MELAEWVVLLWMVFVFLIIPLFIVFNGTFVECKICKGGLWMVLPLVKMSLHKIKTDQLVPIDSNHVARLNRYCKEYTGNCFFCKTELKYLDTTKIIGENLGKPQNATICKFCEGSGQITHKVHYSWFLPDGKVKLKCTDCKGEPIKL